MRTPAALLLLAVAFTVAGAASQVHRASVHRLDLPGEYELRAGGLLRDPLSGVNSVSESEEGLLFEVATSVASSLVLDFTDGSPVPKKGISWTSSAAADLIGNGLTLSGLQRGSAVHLRHLSSSAGVMVVDGREVAFDGASVVSIRGRPSAMTVDLTDYGHLSSPVLLETSVSLSTDEEVLMISSLGGEFQTTSIECDGIENLRLIAGTGSDPVRVGDMPSAFTGTLHVDGGSHEVIVEGQRESKHSGNFTGRVTVTGRSPCPGSITGNFINFGGSCICGGTDDIIVTGTGPSATVNFLPGSVLQTDAGDIVFAVTDGTLDYQGTLTTNTGAMFADAKCNSQDCTGITWGGLATIGGNVFIEGLGLVGGVHVQASGSIIASTTSGSFTLKGNLADSVTSFDVAGVRIGGTVDVQDYNVVIDSVVACNSVLSDCTGFFLDDTGQLNLGSSVGGTTLSTAADIKADISCGTPACYGARVEGTLTLLNIATLLNGTAESTGPTSGAVGVFITGTAPQVTATNSNLHVLGDTRATLQFHQAVSIDQAMFSFVPGSGGNAGVLLDGRMSSTGGLGAFFELANFNCDSSDLTITTASSPAHGGVVNGIDSDTVSLNGDTLTVVTIVGDSGPFTPTAGWIDDSSTLIYTGHVDITTTAPPLSSGSHASGLNWSTTDLTAGSVDISASLNNAATRTDMNVGIQFNGVMIDITSPSSSFITGSSGCGSSSSTQNHGIVFSGSCSINSEGDVTVTGTSGPLSSGSYGTYILNGALGWSTGLLTPANIFLVGNALPGSPSGGPNHGIVIHPAGNLNGNRGDMFITGDCQDNGCNGVHFVGAMQHEVGDIIVSGTGGFNSGAFMNGAISVNAAPVAVSITGNADAAGAGKGVILDTSFDIFGNSPSDLTVMGTGGDNGNEAHGVLINCIISVDDILVIGQGGANGAGVTGVTINSIITIEGTSSFVGTSGCQSGGSNCVGVELIGALTSSHVSGVMISGTVSGGTSPTGVSILGSIAAAGDISIDSAGNVVSDDVVGVLFEGFLSTPAAAVFMSAAVNSPLGGVATLLSAGSMEASAVDISGINALGGDGVGLQMASDFLGFNLVTTANFYGEGQTGVDLQTSLSFASCEVSIEAKCEGSDSGNMVGINFAAPFSLSGGSSSAAITSSVGDITSSQNGNIGIVIDADLNFRSHPALVESTARGAGATLGLIWQSGAIEGTSVDIMASVESSQPGTSNTGVFINSALVESLSNTQLSIQGTAVSDSNRSDDVGIVSAGTIDISFSSLTLIGAGGSGSTDGGIGILFTQGSLGCVAGYFASHYEIFGSGDGTGNANAGVVFGSSFSGFDGSGAALGECTLSVTGTGSSSSDGMVNDNCGIRFEGDFTSNNFNSDFVGTGHGTDGHGIFMGPNDITFGVVADEIILNGTTTGDSTAAGIFCDDCNLTSLEGDLTLIGDSPIETNTIGFAGGFFHPNKNAGDISFLDFVAIDGGFSLIGGSTNLLFAEGVTFTGGSVTIDTDRVDFLVATIFSGIEATMTVRATPIRVTGTFSSDNNVSNVIFERNVEPTGDVTFSSAGLIVFESLILGDFADLTLSGTGRMVMEGSISNFIDITVDVDTFEVNSRGFSVQADGELVFLTDVDITTTATAFMTFSGNDTVVFDGDIIGPTSDVFMEVRGPLPVFSDSGSYVLNGEIFLSEEIGFQEQRSVEGYYREIPRWSSMTPMFGDFVAHLPGNFMVPVAVGGHLTALASGTFTDLRMEANSWLKPGATLLGTGCFTCQTLEFDHDSILVINIDGPPSPSNMCNNQYDRIETLNVFSISSNTVTIDASTGPGVVFGETYPIVTGQSTASGVFSNLPEGGSISSSPALIATYLGGFGADFNLRTNQLAMVEDDSYAGVPPISIPAPGILANDTDPDFDTLSVAFTSPLSPPNQACQLTVGSSGNLDLIGGGCVGVYTFTYQVTDGFDLAGPGTVTINALLPSQTPTQTPTMSATPTPSISLTSTVSLSPSTTPSASDSVTATASPTASPSPTSSTTNTASATRSTTNTASATQSGTATATMTETPTSSTTNTASATTSPTGTRTPTQSPTGTASITASTTMSVTATSTDSATASQTASSTASPSPTRTASMTGSSSPTPSTTQSQGATASKTPTKSQSKTRTISSSKSPTRTPTSTRTPSKTGTASRTSTSSPTTTPSVSKSPSATKTASTTGTTSRTPSKTPSKTQTPTSSLSRGSTPSATASSTVSESSTPTSTATSSSTATASVSLTSTSTGTSSASLTGTPSSTPTPTGSSSPSSSPTASASEALASPSGTTAASSSTPSPTPIVASALPSQSRPASSPSAAAEAPAIASVSPSRTSLDRGGAVVVPSTLPNPSRSVCIGAFCVSPNPAPAPNDIPLEVEVLPEGTDTIKDVRNEEGKEIGRVRVPGDSGGAVLVVNQASSNVRLVEEVVTDVVDVTIVDNSGNVVDTFDGEDVEVCFSTEDFDSNEVCLGFYNDDEVWECQDYCLSTTSGTDGEDLLCGNTPHLTNFALLLSDEAGSESRCGSSSLDLLYVYLSIGAVGLAVFVILIAVVARESYLRYDVYQTNKRLTYGGSSGRGLGTGSGGSSGMASFSTD